MGLHFMTKLRIACDFRSRLRLLWQWDELSRIRAAGGRSSASGVTMNVSGKGKSPYWSANLLKHYCIPSACADSSGESAGPPSSWLLKLPVVTLLGLALVKNLEEDSEGKQGVTTQFDRELFLSVKSMDEAALKRLIKKGADVNCVHRLGWTPLMVAAANGHHRMIEILLENGAEVDAGDEFTPGDMARKRGSAASAYDILDTRENEFADYLSTSVSFRGLTPLHYAALSSSHESVKSLITAGADPFLRDCQGHRAVEYAGDAETKSILLGAEKEWTTRQKQREVEERRRFPLEKRLQKHLVGQRGAINSVGAAVRRKESGWVAGDHPLVFLFLGSSGVGKTELAKRLADHLHPTKTSGSRHQSGVGNRHSEGSDRHSNGGAPAGGFRNDQFGLPPGGWSTWGGGSPGRGGRRAETVKKNKNGFIRFDMSEYQEKHEVSKFIGSPPGYVGFEEGGQLTEALRNSPDAVVLFDEVEKAHPDVLACLLQLFDEGRLTDGRGETIECKDAIFVMTSNLASEEISQHALGLRKESRIASGIRAGVEPMVSDDVSISRDFKDRIIRPILKSALKRDEFLGRINEIVYFLPFSRAELLQLVEKEMVFWAETAKERHSIKLYWDHAALDTLSEGYDVHYGARSIKHEVEKSVIAKVALGYELESIRPNSEILVKGRSLDAFTGTYSGNVVTTCVEILIRRSEQDEWEPLDVTISTASAR